MIIKINTIKFILESLKQIQMYFKNTITLNIKAELFAEGIVHVRCQN